MSGQPAKAPPLPRNAREAIDAWQARRRQKSTRISIDILTQVRRRGIDPDDLGLTLASLRARFFGLTEAELDEIIDRAGVP